MSWVIYAIASIFLIGAFNLFLEATKDTIPKGFHYTHMYLCCILVLAGVLAGISLICYHFLYPNALSDISSKIKPSYYLLFFLCFFIERRTDPPDGMGRLLTCFNCSVILSIISNNSFIFPGDRTFANHQALFPNAIAK